MDDFPSYLSTKSWTISWLSSVDKLRISDNFASLFQPLIRTLKNRLDFYCNIDLDLAINLVGKSINISALQFEHIDIIRNRNTIPPLSFITVERLIVNKVRSKSIDNYEQLKEKVGESLAEILPYFEDQYDDIGVEFIKKCLILLYFNPSNLITIKYTLLTVCYFEIVYPKFYFPSLQNHVLYNFITSIILSYRFIPLISLIAKGDLYFWRIMDSALKTAERFSETCVNFLKDENMDYLDSPVTSLNFKNYTGIVIPCYLLPFCFLSSIEDYPQGEYSKIVVIVSNNYFQPDTFRELFLNLVDESMTFSLMGIRDFRVHELIDSFTSSKDKYTAVDQVWEKLKNEPHLFWDAPVNHG